MEETKEVQLARELANSLNDPTSFELFLGITAKYHEDYLRDKLNKTLQVPDVQLAKNRTLHFMQIVTSGDARKITIWEFVRPALGYFSVAFVCLLSGNSLRNGGSFKEIFSIGLEQFLYLIFLIPVFVCRVIMYEKRDEVDPKFVDEEWIKISKQVPRIFLFLSLFIFLITCIAFWQRGFKYPIEPGKLFCSFIAVVPIIIQTAKSWKIWKNNSAHDFDFRYYIFFPALSTCIISFMVGWTELESYKFILIPSSVIILYYYLSIKTKTLRSSNWKYPDYAFLVLFLFFFVAGYVWVIPKNEISLTELNNANGWFVLLACSMMTLMMGLTESWWLVKDNNNFKKLNSDNRLNFYYERVNQFSIFLPIGLILMIFDQHVNVWFFFIIIYSLSISFIWLILQHTSIKNITLIENKGWRGIRLFFGMTLPIFFAFSLSPNFRGLHVSINDLNIPNLGTYLALSLTICINVIGVFKYSALNTYKKISIIIVSSIIIILGVTSSVFKLTLQSETVAKFNIIQLYCFLAGLIFLFGKFDRDSELGEKNNIDSNNDGMVKQKINPLQNLLLFIQSGRPIPSLLSGLYSYILLYNRTHQPIFSLLKIFPIILVTMLAFVFNDIFDIEKDKLAKKNRPITTGRLSIKIANIYSWVTIIITITFEILINNYATLIVIFLTLLGVYFYSMFSKNLPLLKVLYTAIICCTPIIYGDMLIGINIEFYKLVPVLLFIVGREIWLDKIDLKSDIKANLKTIPSYLGKTKSIRISFILMTLGVFVIIYESSNVVSFIWSVSSLSILILCGLLYSRHESLSVVISRFSILLGIVALALT